MKKLLFLLIIIGACSSFQKKKVKHPVAVATQKKKIKKVVPVVQKIEIKQTVPAAIQAKIEGYKKMDKNEQPTKVVEYEYRGNKVYYVRIHCCDFFNELFDSAGVLMGHPDGGFTGRGDNTLPDFNKEKTKEKIIWEPGN